MVKETSGRLKKYIELVSENIRKYSDPIALVFLSIFDSLTEFDEDEARDEAKDIAVEHFQQKFAERFVTYPIIVILLIIVVGVVDWSQCGGLSNQMYGLSIDLIGALILGRGLLMGGVAIGAVAGTRFGYNPLLIKTLAKDSVDGVWGVSLILVGIALQIIAVGQLYPDLPLSLSTIC